MKVHFELHGTQDMVKISSLPFPLLPGLIKCLIYLVLEGDHKSTKNGLATRVKIGVDAARSGNNTNLLVVMRVRLSQNIGLIDLMNWT